MIFVRLIVAFGSAYFYYYVLGTLAEISSLKWLQNASIADLITSGFGLVIFLGVLLWPYYKKVKLKAEELRKMATDMGFVFHGDNYHPDPSLLQSPLFRHGYRHRFGPAITGQHKGVNIQLFEHVYSEPGGASDSGDTPHVRIVVVFPEPGFPVPDFVMHGKSFADRMFEKIYRSKTIHFEDNSKFSRRYALAGPNQEKVLKFFTPELRAAFIGSEKKWTAAGINSQLMLLTDESSNDQLKPENFINYLKMALAIFEILRSGNRSGRETA